MTGPEAGITRDAIAVDLDWRGRRLRIHDTAGLRRRSRIEEKLEKLSVADAINAIRFAEVVIVLIDAQTPFEEQDIRIADLVEREGRAIVIGLNKWDLIEPAPGALSRALRRNRSRLAADQGRPRRRAVGAHRRRARSADGGGVESHAVWNQPRADRRAQPLSRRGGGGACAARRSRTPQPARLHYASRMRVRRASCCFRRVLTRSPKLIAAICQWLARDFQAAGHADPADAARQGQSLCRPKTPR